jgi:hypothetical protein
MSVFLTDRSTILAPLMIAAATGIGRILLMRTP